MKQLSLSPPLLIITMGYPGSGKSFFARQFAETYGVARVSEERIRFELFESPQFNDDEADIIARIRDYSLEQLMQTKQTVICDSTFGSVKERKALQDFARANGYKTLTVWLQTDVETSYQRAAKRDRRNQDSKYSFSLNRQIFDHIKDRLQRPGDRETSVVVSGKHAFKSQNLTVLKKIAAMYSADLEKSSTASAVTRPPISRAPGGQRFIQ